MKALKPQLLVGIDPGDRWIGMATMRIELNYCTIKCDMAVFDENVFPSFNRMVQQLTPSVTAVLKHRVSVITEEFRIRPQEFNRFSASRVPALIGAIRYVTAESGAHWTEVAAGNAEKDLKEFGFTLFLNDWALHCSGDSNWRHARSAWRVILKHLMTTDPNLLHRIISSYSQAEFGFIENPKSKEAVLVAPTMRWRLPT